MAHQYYVIWSGALNLGDTPGVFMDAEFAGLLLQIPITITSLPPTSDPIEFMLVTTEVEIFLGKKHPVYWDWSPGTALPQPVGFIDDTSPIPDKPEYHKISVDIAAAAVGKHWLTVQVNPEVAVGLRDDFVLKRIEAHQTFGARVGWS